MNKKTILPILLILCVLFVGSFAQAQQINVVNRGDADISDEKPDNITPKYIEESWLTEMKFVWNEPVGASLFYKNNNLWLVFDRFVEFSLQSVREKARPFITSSYQRNSSNGTVLVFGVNKDYNYKLVPDGNSWALRVYHHPIPTENFYIPRAIQTPEKGKILLIPDRNANGIVGTVDDVSGNILLIGTTLNNNVAQGARQRFQGFNLLNTQQGLVVESFVDNLSLQGQRDGFHISSITPLPLSLSDNNFAEETTATSYFSNRPIFHWKKWHGDDKKLFLQKLDKHYELLSAIATQNINDARLALARYYLSYMFGAEAKGILDLMFLEYPFLFDLPETRSLYGVALFFSNRYDDALKILDNDNLNFLSEIMLWRGALYAKQGRWKDAEEAFLIGERFILEYPEAMRIQLASLRLESAIQAKNKDIAIGWLTFVKEMADVIHPFQRSKIDLLNGLYIMHFEEDKTEATRIFSDLRFSRNKLVNTRARFNLTRILYDEGNIDISTAIKELNSVRYGWRGDIIEAEIILQLAKYYLQNNQHKEGLTLLRNGISYIEQPHMVEIMNELMEEYFITLFYEGKSDSMSVLDALALYNEFRELTPPGVKGNYIIERLAMRLLSIDLLNRSIYLLEYQIKYRLEGRERARVGTKLAIYYILNRQPEKAISVLDNTRFPGLPNALLAERRRILSKAFIDVENFARARRLLVGDVTRDAELLRLEIFWKTQNWFEVANVIRRLLGPAPTSLEEDINKIDARLALNLAAVLKLIDDYQGLQILRNAYLPFMQRTFYGLLFDTLTASELDDVNIGVDGGILQQISGEEFNLFIDRYKKRVLDPSEEFLGLHDTALQNDALQNKSKE